MRAGGGFGVVLDGKGFFLFAGEAFAGVVVQIQMSQFHAFTFERIHIDAKAVVLAGDFNLVL